MTCAFVRKIRSGCNRRSHGRSGCDARHIRLLAVAIVGWLALSAQHPNPIAEPQQPNAQERSAHALENIATNYDKQAKGAERSPESNPCEPGDDQRNSDLCAQWKAADAATDSAWWASRGTWISGVSGLLVLVAIGLAFHSNWIARDTAKRQLRAYVSIAPGTLGNITPDSPMAFLFRQVNSGQTPAYSTQHEGIMILLDYPLADDFPFPDLPQVSVSKTAISPRDDFIGVLSSERPFTQPELVQIFRGAEKGIRLFIFAQIAYVDAFGASHWTRGCYSFPGLLPLVPLAEQGNWLEIAKAIDGKAMHFELAPQHNVTDDG